MKIYELTCIVSSQLASQAVDLEKSAIESFIQEQKGVILKSEKPIARTLSYPIKNNASGYLFSLEFQITEDKIAGFNAILRNNKNLVRYSISIKKKEKLMKKKRVRKPIFSTDGKTSAEPQIIGALNAENTKKVDSVDLDKKLDEILSE